MKKIFVFLTTIITLLTGCTKSDHGYSECLKYCNEENVIVFYWALKETHEYSHDEYNYDMTYWRFGMCRTPSDESIPTKDELKYMHNNMSLDINELETLLKDTNHLQYSKTSIYFTRKNMTDLEYDMWKYNYPLETVLVKQKIFERFGITEFK